MEVKNNKDNTTIIFGTILLFSFIVFLFYGSYKRDETNLIREDLVNDSIIFKQNYNLQFKDSIILKNNDILRKTIILHEKRIQSLEKAKHFHPLDTSKL
jgi:hypothetical protein